MKITDELINYVAELSRLSLSKEEAEKAKGDLSDILDYMEKLNGLNTEGVAELSHPFEDTNRFREDQVTNADQREAMLSNAPDRRESYFKVFRTVE